jgi:hypothetical protein
MQESSLEQTSCLDSTPWRCDNCGPFAVRVPARRWGPHRPTLDYYQEALDAQNIAELARAGAAAAGGVYDQRSGHLDEEEPVRRAGGH